MKMMQASKKKYLLTLCTLSLAALGACSPTLEKRGNTLEDYQIKEIVPGVHTRSDVLRLLGSPTTQSTFDENVWYYIGRTTEKRGILDPDVVEQRVIMVSFNEEDVVENLAEINGDQIDVPVSKDATPTHGNELTVIQQLLGNLGRFNPQTEE